jgi:hypothetical protein
MRITSKELDFEHNIMKIDTFNNFVAYLINAKVFIMLFTTSFLKTLNLNLNQKLKSYGSWEDEEVQLFGYTKYMELAKDFDI